MKKIEAIIRLATLESVIAALARVGVPGMTLEHVRGCGRQKGHSELYRGADHVVDLLAKVKLEVLVADEQVEDIVDALRTAAQTGRIGDGKIFVWPVEEAVRIRTGERGQRAL